MIQTDYPIEAWEFLLDRDCLMERYAPLIPYQHALLSELYRLGCRTKNDAASLSDDVLRQIGLCDDRIIGLFRRFLVLYDPNPQKFREIAKFCPDPEEQSVFWELYHLPGVKAIRASLYARSGYRSLRDFADAQAEEVLERTARTIRDQKLSCAVPLPKEVRTQIAVARAFTMTGKETE